MFFGTVYLTSAIHCHVKANKQPTSGFEAHLYLRIFSTEAQSQLILVSQFVVILNLWNVNSSEDLVIVTKFVPYLIDFEQAG